MAVPAPMREFTQPLIPMRPFYLIGDGQDSERSLPLPLVRVVLSHQDYRPFKHTRGAAARPTAAMANIHEVLWLANQALIQHISANKFELIAYNPFCTLRRTTPRRRQKKRRSNAKVINPSHMRKRCSRTESQAPLTGTLPRFISSDTLFSVSEKPTMKIYTRPLGHTSRRRSKFQALRV